MPAILLQTEGDSYREPLHVSSGNPGLQPLGVSPVVVTCDIGHKPSTRGAEHFHGSDSNSRSSLLSLTLSLAS